MECPFLKKISFKKVNQIVSDQLECEITSEMDLPEEESFDFEEESVELINSSQINPHQIYYFNSKITPPQSSHQHLVIKFPKQFQTKSMTPYSHSSQNQQNPSEDIVTSQGDISSCKNVPQVLVSKMSMLNAKCEDIFQGQVTLEGEEGVFRCQVKDRVIKIFKPDKIKLFIEMDKAEVRLDDIKGNRARLWASVKDKYIGAYIKFGSTSKLMSFAKALQLNNFQIESFKENEQKTNLSYSLDSLGFEVQRMPMERLLDIGDTFDIILFKNKSLMSKVQRIFTNSDYDHVAMILRASNQEMFLFQSTSNAGVAVYTLQSLIKLPKKKYYIRVGYRKYKGNRKISEVYKLQQFIKASLGKRYKFDPMYLITTEAKKEDTFFCSELVASALQQSGIMSQTHQPYKFLPKHFASDDLNDSIVSGSFADTVVLQ